MNIKKDLPSTRRRPCAAGLAILLAAALSAQAVRAGGELPGTGSRVDSEQGLVLPVLTTSGPDYAEGDVIFLRGTSPRSSAVLSARPGSRYSHVGLLVREGGRWALLHATPGGGEDAEPASGVLLECVDQVIARMEATDVAVYRVGPSINPEKAVAAARSWLGRPFNHGFDRYRTDQLYCTQLVRLAFLESGEDLTDDKWDRVRLPFACAGSAVILPDSLLRTEVLQRVASWELKSAENDAVRFGRDGPNEQPGDADAGDQPDTALPTDQPSTPKPDLKP